MLDWFKGLDPVLQAFIATCFTWGLTGAGAALVFLVKDVEQRVLDGLLGFTAGVMIAASFWSLLAPAIEIAQDKGQIPWLVAASGFLAGGVLLRVADAVLPHLHIGYPDHRTEGVETGLHRVTLLVLAITLHNFPEGLAVGVSFGAIAYDLPGAGFGPAVALAIGIGLQNFPEGIAVSMPLRREGTSRFMSFWYGQMSAMVEPIAGVIGAVAVLTVEPMLPFALSFAAGAMIYVVVEEVVPESHRAGFEDTATSGAMIGFTIMMILDVALG